MNNTEQQHTTAPESDYSSISKKIKPSRVWIPIAIGIASGAILLYNEFDPSAFDKVSWSPYSFVWIILACLCMICRDLYYIIRVKLLSDNQLTWKKAFNVIMMWEFTSAITPGAVGGTSFAVLYIKREGIPLGKSSAIVMLTSFLDELFFIIVFPLLFLIVGYDNLFTIGGEAASTIMALALGGYSLKFAYTLLIAYGLFINPRSFNWLILKIFKLRFLRKWRFKAQKTGSDIVLASKAFKQKDLMFWAKALSTTFISWLARYWVVNFLLLALFADSSLNLFDNILVFARQFVMWIILLLAPTPGGSGAAEYLFTTYLGQFIPVGLAGSVAILWRLVTYYPYLFIGAVMVPRWLKNTFKKS